MGQIHYQANSWKTRRTYRAFAHRKRGRLLFGNRKESLKSKDLRFSSALEPTFSIVHKPRNVHTVVYNISFQSRAKLISRAHEWTGQLTTTTFLSSVDEWLVINLRTRQSGWDWLWIICTNYLRSFQELIAWRHHRTISIASYDLSTRKRCARCECEKKEGKKCWSTLAWEISSAKTSSVVRDN